MTTLSPARPTSRTSREKSPAEIVEQHRAEIVAHLRAIVALMPAHGPSASYDALESLDGLIAFYTQSVTNPHN